MSANSPQRKIGIFVFVPPYFHVARVLLFMYEEDMLQQSIHAYLTPFFRGVLFSLLAGWVCLGAPGLAPASFAFAKGSAPTAYNVGMRNFGVWDKERGERIDFSAWYPSRVPSSETVREGWKVEFGRTRRPYPGFFPVVLVSHDTASSRFANNDLYSAMASGGMVVIVPNHTGDNQHGSDGAFTAKLLRERPRHLLLALDTLLNTPEFSLFADESRIGLLGVGAGCVTVLQLLGVEPDFTRLSGYCGAASVNDAYCSSWVQKLVASVPGDSAALKKKYGPDCFTPPLDLFAPTRVAATPLSPEEIAALSAGKDKTKVRKQVSLWQLFMQVVFNKDEEAEALAAAKAADEAEKARQARVLHNELQTAFWGAELLSPMPIEDSYLAFSLSEELRVRPEREKIALAQKKQQKLDPRYHAFLRSPEGRSIQSLALFTPAGGVLYTRESLQNIRMPVALVEAGGDDLYAPAQHSAPFMSLFPSQPLVLSFPGVDHFSLFARCSRETMVTLGEVCGRLVGEARDDVDEQKQRFLTAFFQSSLGGMLPSAVPSGFIAEKITAPE